MSRDKTKRIRDSIHIKTRFRAWYFTSRAKPVCRLVKYFTRQKFRVNDGYQIIPNLLKINRDLSCRFENIYTISRHESLCQSLNDSSFFRSSRHKEHHLLQQKTRKLWRSKAYAKVYIKATLHIALKIKRVSFSHAKRYTKQRKPSQVGLPVRVWKRPLAQVNGDLLSNLPSSHWWIDRLFLALHNSETVLIGNFEISTVQPKSNMTCPSLSTTHSSFHSSVIRKMATCILF